MPFFIHRIVFNGGNFDTIPHSVGGNLSIGICLGISVIGLIVIIYAIFGNIFKRKTK